METLKKYTINFSKYSAVGIAATILSVFFSWLFINVLGVTALVASSIIGFCIFFAKYFGYRKVKLIKSKFILFTFVNLIFTLLYIILSWLFIDILKYPTLIVIPGITIVLFFLRYIAFYLAGIIIE